MKEDYDNYIIYGIAALVIIVLLFNIASFFSFPIPLIRAHSIEVKATENSAGNSASLFSKPKMTAFDMELAKRKMDKDNDEKCDACGMDIDICISSGMLECSMDKNAKIGLLNSAHIHTDFKVYFNGEMINFNDEKYFKKSAFIHVEPEENSEETGKVLHIHAIGVPLSMFFESIGLNLDSSRLFVNGEEKGFGTYVPEDQDKILVTTSDDDLIRQELDSITDYAKKH